MIRIVMRVHKSMQLGCSSRRQMQSVSSSWSRRNQGAAAETSKASKAVYINSCKNTICCFQCMHWYFYHLCL